MPKIIDIKDVYIRELAAKAARQQGYSWRSICSNRTVMDIYWEQTREGEMFWSWVHNESYEIAVDELKYEHLIEDLLQLTKYGGFVVADPE